MSLLKLHDEHPEGTPDPISVGHPLFTVVAIDQVLTKSKPEKFALLFICVVDKAVEPEVIPGD